MKQQFFVGDKVCLADKIDKHSHVFWIDGIEKFKGITGVVQDIVTYEDGNIGYSVQFDNHYYNCDAKWLTLVERAWQKNTGEQPVDGCVRAIHASGRESIGPASMKVWEIKDGEDNVVSWRLPDSPIPEEVKERWRREMDAAQKLYNQIFPEDAEDCVEAIPPSHVAIGGESVSTDVSTGQEWTDKHYDNNYTLTQKNIERGFVKIDPYRVSKQWRLGSKDESGVLFHILKTVARFGEKNSREREIKALYAQIKCLAEIEGVDLNG